MPFATVKGDGSAEVLSGDRLKYLGLWDVYSPLLTEAQRDMCERYFLCDLSLSEIAEEKGVSKQAVSDTLKKSRELLDSYEEKLHVKRDGDAYSLAVSDMMTKVSRALRAFAERHPEYAEQMGEIADMVCLGDVTPLGEEE